MAVTTTTYGSWANVDGMSLTVEQTVMDSLGEWGTDGYDFDAIVSDYRAAIDAALPVGVSLCGNEFIGPYLDHRDFDLAEIVASVDLWPIIERHELNTADIESYLPELLESVYATILRHNGIENGDISPGLLLELEDAEKRLAGIVARWVADSVS